MTRRVFERNSNVRGSIRNNDEEEEDEFNRISNSSPNDDDDKSVLDVVSSLVLTRIRSNLPTRIVLLESSFGDDDDDDGDTRNS